MTILLQGSLRSFSWKLSLERGIFLQTKLSSRPERTRISCLTALDTTTCAAFVKESRMKFTNATKLNRKSGVAQRRDLRFSVSYLHMFVS